MPQICDMGQTALLPYCVIIVCGFRPAHIYYHTKQSSNLRPCSVSWRRTSDARNMSKLWTLKKRKWKCVSSWLCLVRNYVTMMHGQKNIKFISSQQARQIYKFSHITRQTHIYNCTKLSLNLRSCSASWRWASNARNMSRLWTLIKCKWKLSVYQVGYVYYVIRLISI
jgi:hypothetical protein